MANKSENETMRILKTLNRYAKFCARDMFHSIDIINEKTIRFKPVNDLADDCLLTVSLFKKHVEELYRHRAAPSINWYIQVGASSFEKLGYYDIAGNYEFWYYFIREHIFA